ncbi:MAG: hypothetical protein Q9218_006111 [Villophora microphyllina]
MAAGTVLAVSPVQSTAKASIKLTANTIHQFQQYPAPQQHWSPPVAGQEQYAPVPPTSPPFQQHPQSQSSPPATSPAGKFKKNMKHMTCHFWFHYGSCRLPDSECLYAHEYLGPNSIAEKPVLRERGKPAVAGINALKETPEYHDWDEIHGRTRTIPTWETPSEMVDQSSPQERQEKREQEYARQEAAQQATKAILDAFRSTTAQLTQQESVQTLIDRQANTVTKPSLKRAFSDEPLSTNLESTNESQTSSLPGKAVKLDIEPSSSTAEANISTNDMERENIVLRQTVQTLSLIVSDMMRDSIATRAKGDQHINTLMQTIFALPIVDRDPLLRSLAGCMLAMTNNPIEAENKAKESMNAVRRELIKVGHGGLMTAWDSEFCKSQAEKDKQGMMGKGSQ